MRTQHTKLRSLLRDCGPFIFREHLDTDEKYIECVVCGQNLNISIMQYIEMGVPPKAVLDLQLKTLHD